MNWIKLALGGTIILGIPLIYFFSSSEEKETIIDSKNEFVKQTEQLLADLSKQPETVTEYAKNSADKIKLSQRLLTFRLRH